MRDKVVAITGGFGALGATVGDVLQAKGAKLALLDRAAAPAARADTLLIGQVDLSGADGARRAVQAIEQRYGRLDALINIAGAFRWERVAGGDLATWDLMFAVNLKTAVAMSQAALGLLESSGAGRIVNVAAAGALKAGIGMGAYAASKSGVMRLTEALAEEVKDKGVTVNAVLPSTIDTPANRAEMPDADFSRWVTPTDLAAVIAFLISDEARAVNGALIPVVGRV